jgi:hypothetical protein
MTNLHFKVIATKPPSRAMTIGRQGFYAMFKLRYFRKIKESSSKNLILQVARLAARGKS